MVTLRNHLVRIGSILAVALGALAAGPTQASAQAPRAMAPSAPATCTPSWQVVTSLNGASTDNALGGVAAITSTDVWATGNTGAGLSPLNTLTEHWNGTSWTVLPSPNGSFAANYLPGVDGVASNDVWAVGFSSNASTQNSRSRTLILHWNGTTWSAVSSPNTTQPDNRLYGVVAVSANDVWAVGQAFGLTSGISLIMHWDGTSWSIVSSPSPGIYYSTLYAVDAAAANDVWAVGTRQDFQEQTMVFHWDGTSWSVVTSPQVGPYGNNLLDVSVTAANDVWAVGYHLTVVGFTEPFQTSILHYDGASWAVVPSPNVNPLNNYLYDVAGLSANDAWAVGFFDTGSVLNTMVQHWDGTSWTIGSSPNPGSVTDELYAVAADSASNLWAVGRSADGEVGVNTLVERLSNACAATMHVASITPSFKSRTGSFQVRASVGIQDSSNVAVSGATVTVNITRPDASVVTRNATTSTNGQAVVSVTSTQTGTYTFTVTSVAKAGFTYDPAANVETSDSITVQ